MILTNIGKLGRITSENLVKDGKIMNKEDILKAVQETSSKGEYEKTVARSALHIAIFVGIICALIMILIEWWVFKKFDFGKPFLIALTAGLADILEYKGNKLKKMFIMGVCKLIFAAFLLLMYIFMLMGVA